jgi:TldD protein
VKTKTRGSTRAQLERDLLRRAREDGYDFAYVVEGLRDNNILGPVDREGATGYGGGRKVSLPLPARIFRIDGVGQAHAGARGDVQPGVDAGAAEDPGGGQRAVAVPMRIPPGYTGGFGAETGMDGILSHTVDVQVSSPGSAARRARAAGRAQ